MADSENLLDQTDYRILRELVRDGRAPDVAVAERVNLSSTAVAPRRNARGQAGAVSGYSASLDLGQLGFNVVVLVMIELSSQAEHVLVEFEEAVKQCPSMSFCSFVSGDTDFVMMVHVRSFADYDRVYRRELSRLPYVARIRSSFIMRQVVDRKVPPSLFGDRSG